MLILVVQRVGRLVDNLAVPRSVFQCAIPISARAGWNCSSMRKLSLRLPTINQTNQIKSALCSKRSNIMLTLFTDFVEIPDEFMSNQELYKTVPQQISMIRMNARGQMNIVIEGSHIILQALKEDVLAAMKSLGDLFSSHGAHQSDGQGSTNLKPPPADISNINDFYKKYGISSYNDSASHRGPSNRSDQAYQPRWNSEDKSLPSSSHYGKSITGLPFYIEPRYFSGNQRVWNYNAGESNIDTTDTKDSGSAGLPDSPHPVAVNDRRDPAGESVDQRDRIAKSESTHQDQPVANTSGYNTYSKSKEAVASAPDTPSPILARTPSDIASSASTAVITPDTSLLELAGPAVVGADIIRKIYRFKLFNVKTDLSDEEERRVSRRVKTLSLSCQYIFNRTNNGVLVKGRREDVEQVFVKLVAYENEVMSWLVNKKLPQRTEEGVPI
ncbi:hypothetical protein SeMB42_g01706 [Synchytrium endobioticum]|uniref:Uncharacterized protein n=1 Tax=Synchytrium endobioticum TaxID=286115 RepID=A0A507DM94_9FUNG|nr:hypothetical protein SeMB42_g01706 [Synchytrium endobioticum]